MVPSTNRSGIPRPTIVWVSPTFQPVLTPGSSVTLRIGSEARRVVAVPKEAIGEGYALVWDSDRTSLRQVTVGNELPGERVEVVSGLAPGEKIVRNGP